MRFVSLEVGCFQGVKSARIDFGSGLNILYGPNDLGKSSLATAIRAALLLQTNSSEAEAFHPWHSAEKATVSLVFTDAAGRYWKVKKAFGASSGAQLWFSKDGKSWTPDEKAREVDSKLRTLLPWGIPSPGGKGAPRGWPESFLTNALFGAQSDVDGILGVGLDGDKADSGQVALRSALSALAQDPLVKKVLAVAQAESDKYFTEKGTAKRGQTAALTLAGEAVKKLQSERAALAKQVEDALNAEQHTALLRDRRAEVAVELETAKARLAQLEGAFSKSQARQAVVEKLKGVQAELAQVDAQAKRMEEGTQHLTELAAAGEKKKAALAAVKAVSETAAKELKSAEELVRQANSGDSARKRELELAKLATKEATLKEERGRLEALATKASAAARIQAQLDAERKAAEKFAADATRLSEAHRKAVAARVDLEADVKLAENILAFGRWRIACDAAGAVARAHREATRLSADAKSKEAGARQHGTRAQELREEADNKRATLPNESELAELRRLVHEQEANATRAQAELGRAREDITRHSAEAAQLAEAVQRTGKSVDEAEAEVRLAAGLVDYGRWRAAADAADAAAKAQLEAQKLNEEAQTRELEAQRHDERAKALRLECDGQKSKLPTAEQLTELKRLRQEKELAEAALGGGVSVTVRPRRAIALHARADDQAVLALPEVAVEHTVEAERQISLSIGEIVDLEITAGAQEQRRVVEVLQRRWNVEAVPQLERAGAASLEDIETRLSALNQLVATSMEAQATAKEVRTMAEVLRGKAAQLEKHVSPSKEDVDAKEARIAGLPRDVLVDMYSSMGAAWERQGEEKHAAKMKALEKLRATMAALEDKQKETDWQLQDARSREASALAAPPPPKAEALRVVEIEAGLAMVNKLVAMSSEEEGKAKEARAAAVALRDQAALLEKEVPPTKEDLDAKEARIGAASRDSLLKQFTSMGRSWEAQSESLRVAKTKALQELNAQLTELELEQKEAVLNLEGAKRREASAAGELQALIEALGGGEPLAIQTKLEVELEANAKAAKQLEAAAKSLSEGASSAMEAANKALAAAKTAVEARAADVRRVEGEVAEVQERLHAKQGEVKALQDHLAAMNRGGIEVRLAALREELAAFGAVGVSDVEVAAAKAAVKKAQSVFDEVKEAFDKADGALSSIAGPMTKDKVQQLDEAILAARMREREISVDADAWKMLRDVLREAEKTESAHLGKALAAPVAARFSALTQGKYGGLAMNQELKMESVGFPGQQAQGPAVLEALSVGTRDQLATLVRLAVASQLKSSILLDDQLVHTDPARLTWFADVLRKLALEAEMQLVVFTCRPLDYVKESDLPGKEAVRTMGPIQLVDLSRVVQ